MVIPLRTMTKENLKSQWEVVGSRKGRKNCGGSIALLIKFYTYIVVDKPEALSSLIKF